MKNTLISGAFDNFNSRDIRLLEEASKLGALHVLVWSDDLVTAVQGTAPRLPQSERQYLLGAVRYVNGITLVKHRTFTDALPAEIAQPDIWVSHQRDDNPARRAFCKANGIEYKLLTDNDLGGFPPPPPMPSTPGRKKVLESFIQMTTMEKSSLLTLQGQGWTVRLCHSLSVLNLRPCFISHATLTSWQKTWCSLRRG